MQYLDGQDVSTEIKGVSAARLFKLPRFNLAFLTNPLIGIRKACLFMNSAVIKAPPYPKPIVAWIVVSMLLVAAIVSFIDRQVIAIVIDDMKSDLAVGDAQIGWLYGIFAVFYALAGFPIAWLSDHKSRKHIIAIGIFFWSLMTITCGLTQNYWQLFLARMGVGVGEATLMPAQISLIGDYFPREKIPLVISVLQAGPIIGTGAAFIIGGYVLEIVAGAGAVVVPFFGELQPWQLTFIYVGLPGLALALLFLLIREPARRPAHDAAGADEKDGPFIALRLFYSRNRHTIVFHHLGFLCLTLVGYTFVFWTVSFFVRVHGYENYTASQIFGWMFLIAGPAGPIIVALFASWLARRGRRDANILAPMISGILGVVFIISVQFMPSSQLAWIMYVPAIVFVNGPLGIAYGALAVITRPPIRARVAALYMLVSSIGILIGPPIAGIFNESIFPRGEGIRYSIMSVSMLFGVLGSALLALSLSHYRRSMDAAAEWAEEVIAPTTSGQISN